MERLAQPYLALGLTAARELLRSPGRVVLSIRVAFWIVLLSGIARAFSIPRAYAVVRAGARVGTRSLSRRSPTELASVVDTVLRTDLPIFRPRCWKRAMVLHRYLLASGVETRINFGVRKQPGGALEGHAWLERDGAPFLEADTSTYVVTFSLPAGTRPPTAPQGDTTMVAGVIH